MLASRLRRLWDAGREAAKAYSRNLCPQLASAIAYRVLFSIVPLAIFLVSFFGLLIQNAERRDELVAWVVDKLLLSPEGSVRLDEAISGLGKPLSSVGLVALLGVLWGASGMMGSMRVALTSIWAGEQRPAWRGKAVDLVLVLLAAVAIAATQVGYGFYLSRFAAYNLIYGSLAAVIGFLFLVYLCAAIFLFGAQLAATWSRADASTAARPR